MAIANGKETAACLVQLFKTGLRMEGESYREQGRIRKHCPVTEHKQQQRNLRSKRSHGDLHLNRGCVSSKDGRKFGKLIT